MNSASFYIDSACEKTLDFDSGHQIFNDYLHLHNDNAVIHYVVDSETDALIAYFALISSALPFGTLEKINGVPVIEIKMFALDKRYRGSGIAPILFKRIIEMVEHFASEYVGAKIILLYSVPVDYVISLYEDSGFQQVRYFF